MYLLHGPIRDYAWGSRSAIAELQGRPVPTEGPEAELWLGAHPAAPALVERGGSRSSLLELLTAEPEHWLGGAAVRRFGARLPFLLKVLAAEAPLSLQAHPDAEQARAGYAAEQAGVGQAAEPAGAGLAAEPAGSAAAAGHAASTGPRHRNYVDPYHKPELLVALGTMEALCGFRDPARSAEALAAFGVPALDPVTAALRGGAGGLREAVRRLLTWPAAERSALLAAALAAPVDSSDAALLHRLAARYPGDPGALVALLLHHVILAPGEAIWMPAGNLHAYLAGTGVEIMAASDNVLRGGLTPKQVDVDELLRVLRFEVLDDPVVRPLPVAPGVTTWPVPVDDFALHRIVLDEAVPAVDLPVTGPRIVLCRAGTIVVSDGTAALTLAAGQAAIGPAAATAALTLRGSGEAYLATAGQE